MNVITIKTGTSIGIEYFIIYPKKLGIGVPDSSAIERTIKFGAFPI
jgi:hypothetical protein